MQSNMLFKAAAGVMPVCIFAIANAKGKLF